MRRFILVSLFIFCAIPALAQTQTIITGVVQGPTGVPATSGYVEFRISPASSSIAYRIPGTGAIAPQVSRCSINASGNVVAATGVGNCLLWGNPTIQPASTCYDIVLAPQNTVRSTIQRQLISGASHDLSQPVFCSNINIVPQYQTITTAPISANLVPAADRAFNLGDSGHFYAQAYIDNLNVNTLSNLTSITVDDFNNRKFCPTTGTLSAAAATAMASLPVTGGVVDCTNRQGAQAIDSNMFAGVTKPGVLLLGATTTTLSVSQVVASGWYIVGAGKGSTVLNYTPATGIAFNFATNNNSQLVGLAVNATSGGNTATGVSVSGSNHVTVSDVRLNGFSKNFTVTGTAATQNFNVRIFNSDFGSATVWGIGADHVVDLKIMATSNYMVANNTSATSHGLVLDTGVSGVEITDLPMGWGSMIVRNTGVGCPTPGNIATCVADADAPPVFLHLNQIIADTCPNACIEFAASLSTPDGGGRIGANYRCEQCWAAFAGGGSGQTNLDPGILVAGGENISFDGCLVRLNYSDGAYLTGGHDVRFDNCSFIGNNFSDQPGRSGVRIGPNVSFWSVTNSVMANNIANDAGHQKYGIFITVGSSTHYTIANNDMSRNETGAVHDEANGTPQIRFGNLGDITTRVYSLDAMSNPASRFEVEGNFYLDFNNSIPDDPVIAVAANDYMRYDRANNSWIWLINNAIVAQMNAGGAAGARLFVGAGGNFYLDYKVSDANSVNLSFDANDYLSFATNTNVLNAVIGNSTKLQVDTTDDATNTAIVVFHNGTAKRVVVHQCVTNVTVDFMTMMVGQTTATCLGF